MEQPRQQFEQEGVSDEPSSEEVSSFLENIDKYDERIPGGWWEKYRLKKEGLKDQRPDYPFLLKPENFTSILDFYAKDLQKKADEVGEYEREFIEEKIDRLKQIQTANKEIDYDSKISPEKAQELLDTIDDVVSALERRIGYLSSKHRGRVLVFKHLVAGLEVLRERILDIATTPA